LNLESFKLETNWVIEGVFQLEQDKLIVKGKFENKKEVSLQQLLVLDEVG